MSTEVTPRQRSVIHLMLLGAFLGSMNQTIMGPALPSIMKDLSINAATAQWLTTIFMLINGVMVPCTAFLMARFRTRPLYMSAMILFGLGTLGAGLSHNFILLLLARVFQALGFGILMPLVSATILIVYPRSQHGRAMATFGLVMSAAPAVGPSLAGWIVDSFGWNWCFLGLAPLIFLDIVIVFFLMSDIGETSHVPLDVLSVFLSTIGFGGLLYGFSSAGSMGWASPHTIGGLVVGVIVTYLFFRRQTRLESPLLQVNVFKTRQFTVGTALGMLFNAALMGGAILTPIYLQTVHGFSAFQAALIMLPAAILSVFTNPIVGRLYDRYGARILVIAGLGVLAVGSYMYAFFQVDSPVWYLLLAYTVRIVGINITIMPMNTWSLARFENDMIPHGNACGTTLRQIAGSVGTAIFVSLYAIVNNLGGGTLESSLHGIQFSFFASGVVITLALIYSIIAVKDRI